jgi:hypothetical protein
LILASSAKFSATKSYNVRPKVRGRISKSGKSS